jgi:hypothetical protein
VEKIRNRRQRKKRRTKGRQRKKGKEAGGNWNI